LSIRKFQVETYVSGARCKARDVAVNQKDDHYRLCLEKWFAEGGIVNFPLAALQAGEEFLEKVGVEQICEALG
jgi:hypothetical protein